MSEQKDVDPQDWRKLPFTDEEKATAQLCADEMIASLGRHFGGPDGKIGDPRKHHVASKLMLDLAASSAAMQGTDVLTFVYEAGRSLELQGVKLMNDMMKRLTGRDFMAEHEALHKHEGHEEHKEEKKGGIAFVDVTQRKVS